MDQKLNQVIAVEKGIKTRAEEFLTSTYHLVQKPILFTGFTRTYQRAADSGDDLPGEEQVVQNHADVLVRQIAARLTELFDITAAKDWGNCTARANVIIDGAMLLENVPATYLLFLEKKLTDIHTFIGKLPVLDPAVVWSRDPNDELYKSAPERTARTNKVPRSHVAVPATKEHPAQVLAYNEDVIVGHWNSVKKSGAVPPVQQQAMKERVEKLQKAVKYAREQANMTVAPEQEVGKKIFDWLFG